MRLLRRRGDEKSNSFAMFIFMLPIIIGVFGLGVDVSRNFLIRTSLQDALDQAVVSGGDVNHLEVRAGQTVVIYGTADGARQPVINAVERAYATNRNKSFGLSCLGSSPVPGAGATRCWQVLDATVADREIRVTVREQSTNVFLRVLGERFKYQTYTLSASAVPPAATR